MPERACTLPRAPAMSGSEKRKTIPCVVEIALLRMHMENEG